MIKSCEMCGKKFVARNKRRKYCCKNCSNKAYYYRKIGRLPKIPEQKKVKPRAPMTCAYCGQKFVALHKKKYCCTNCAKAAHRVQEKRCRLTQRQKKIICGGNLTEKICVGCGKKFTTTVKVQKYCSRNCRLATCRAQHAKPAKVPPAPKTKICALCGEEFTPHHPTQKYCSDKCSAEIANRRSENKKAARKPRKVNLTLEQWVKDARECGMTYGVYRAAIEQLGKTKEELLNENNSSTP